MAPTSSDILGPFYKQHEVYREVVCDNPTFHLTGRVLDVDENPVAGAVLDFWQANEFGVYDDFNLRGLVATDADGIYNLHTVIPGEYELDANEYRCSHIHVIVSGGGFFELVTQLYFTDSKSNSVDNWFDPERVIKQEGNKGTFDIVLERA